MAPLGVILWSLRIFNLLSRRLSIWTVCLLQSEITNPPTAKLVCPQICVSPMTCANVHVKPWHIINFIYKALLLKSAHCVWPKRQHLSSILRLGREAERMQYFFTGWQKLFLLPLPARKRSYVVRQAIDRSYSQDKHAHMSLLSYCVFSDKALAHLSLWEKAVGAEQQWVPLGWLCADFKLCFIKNCHGENKSLQAHHHWLCRGNKEKLD